MVSRTERNEKRVREDIGANIVSRTGRNEKRVRLDIESEYGFPYGKI